MFQRIALIAAASLVATPAFAHTGHGATDFVHGFAHPIGGYDHVLAMVAVGLLAAQLGGHARWVLPVTFVLTMAAGGFLAVAGLPVPMVETGILASVVALGLAIAFDARLPMVASAGAVALFAVFHGYAHGAEMPLDSAGLLYGAGFALATMLLHLSGLAVAMLLARTRVLRPLGGLIAAAGLVLGVAA